MDIVDELIKKFKINVRQIIANSDNTMEDVRNEAYIVLSENFSNIMDNERVFINKLKTRCLKFNKYGKRIESKDRWALYNDREDRMVALAENEFNIDEETICMLEDIKEIIGKESYDFLIYYYTYGCKSTANKFKLSEPTVRKRVNEYISMIRRKLC